MADGRDVFLCRLCIPKRNEMICMPKITGKRTKVTVLLFGVLIAAGLLCVILLSNFYLAADESRSRINTEYGIPYKDDTPEASLKGRLFFKDGYPLEVTTSGTVNTGMLGTYELTYHAKYLFWEKKWGRAVTVSDTTAPVITLKHVDGHYTLPNHPYEEEGYSAYDTCDGDLTGEVTSQEADGVVTYRVTDKSGNQAVIERQIRYDDPIPPKLTLLGEPKITLNAGGTYSEPGFSASDNCDGDITAKVTIDGKVDTRTAGEYLLTYTVQDTYGNETTATRTVVVNAVKNPAVVNPGDHVIYLTFDDGPGPYTKELLAVLAKYNVKATFFVVNGKYNNLIAEEAKAGHSVGIHSATHDYGKIYVGKDAFFEDFFRMRDIILNQTGHLPAIMRFPGGSSNMVSKKYCNGIMTELTKSVTDQGFRYFDWNVSSGDAGETKNTDVVADNVINGIKGKSVSVVLQHDIHKFSVDAVEEIILWGLNNGYTFLPLTETSPEVHHRVQN